MVGVGGYVVGPQDHHQRVPERFQYFRKDNVVGLSDKGVTEQTDWVEDEDDGDQHVVAESPDQLPTHWLD